MSVSAECLTAMMCSHRRMFESEPPFFSLPFATCAATLKCRNVGGYYQPLERPIFKPFFKKVFANRVAHASRWLPSNGRQIAMFFIESYMGVATNSPSAV